MKVIRYGVILLALCAMAAYPQTKDLGMGAFSNEQGPIILVIDASLADLKLDSPYVMFMAFMGGKKDQSITISRNDIVMVYGGQEYKMPSVKELREKYMGENNDRDIYRRLGKEGVISSTLRFYQFRDQYDFFPVLGPRGTVPGEEGSITGYVGFKTRLYFKNPGFKKGDTVLFKVKDKKNPELTGECTVILK